MKQGLPADSAEEYLLRVRSVHHFPPIQQYLVYFFLANIQKGVYLPVSKPLPGFLYLSYGRFLCDIFRG